jgi:L-threonylcarbamoyladenylate synthase
LIRLAEVAGLDGVPGEAAASLRAGGLVIFPTDTLYGLGVDPRSPEAVGRLFRAKGREAGKAPPLLLSGADRVRDWAAVVPDAARRLMAAFWPGALTIVLPAAPGLPGGVAGPDGTVGLRVPAHPVARALAAAAGGAVTGTSANRSGEAGLWRSAGEIVAEFGSEADWLLWDGPVASAAPSTVVGVTGSGGPVCIREGAIPFRSILEQLEKGE